MTNYRGGAEIPTTAGLVILVDAEDRERVTAAGRWTVTERPHTSYAVRQERGQLVYLHTFLTGWPLVDHRNGNGLDNRRANLRPATKSTNAANSRIRSDNTSGYRGVTRRGRRWVAQITHAGTHHYLGIFVTPEEGARAYDAAALEHFGEFARLNFPEVPA